MEFTQLTVGEPIALDMPDESMCIVLINGAPVLFFNFTLTEKNIHAFQVGKSSFGLFAENTLLFFLYKIEGFIDWSDLAFTIHLNKNGHINDDGSYLPFHLVLVDSKSSIIKGIRMVTASPAYRSLLAEIIHKQVAERFDTIAYYKHIRSIYETYPEVSSMLKHALIIEEGGKTLPTQ